MKQPQEPFAIKFNLLMVALTVIAVKIMRPLTLNIIH